MRSELFINTASFIKSIFDVPAQIKLLRRYAPWDETLPEVKVWMNQIKGV